MGDCLVLRHRLTRKRGVKSEVRYLSRLLGSKEFYAPLPLPAAALPPS
jgi:hypothetical protein